MKTYQIELKRVSYVNLTIEADSQDEAEEIAWLELDAHEHRDSDANWEIESIELDEPETETESGEDLAQFYGPSAR
jgi:hypothetical protein